jgi:hypothetical protein
MKRLAISIIFLLSGSLLVLLVLIALRGYGVKVELPPNKATKTAVVLADQARQTAAARPTITPKPTETPTPEPSPTPTETFTPTVTNTIPPTVDEGCDVVIFITDVTIPDGTRINPDTKFFKTWRLYNGGTCTWTTGYQLYFHSGDLMSGPESQRLAGVDVPPGALIDVTVELRAPIELGTYKGYWALKNASGEPFGVGPLKRPFYVEILVAGSEIPPSDTPTP